MLDLDKEEVLNKIIFAPNAFGKTTSANKLNEELIKDGLTPTLFTRRGLDELVQADSRSFFIGKTAVLNKTNSSLKKEMEDFIKKFIKTNFGITNKTNLNNSFFLSQVGLKSLNDFTILKDKEISNKNKLKISYLTDKEYTFTDSEIFDFDLKANKELYNKYKKDELKNLEKLDDIEKEKVLIDSNFFSWLNNIKLFIQNEENNDCPLCGHNYQSHQNLIEAINNKFNTYKTLDEKNQYDSIILDGEFISKTYKLSYFDKLENTSKFINSLLLIYKYISLCDYIETRIIDILLGSKINNNTLSNNIKTYYTNLSSIEKEKEAFDKNNIVNNLIDEFKAITKLDSNIYLIPNRESMSFSLKVDGKKADIYNIFSESELKRLALVVMKYLIITEQANYLILDDPIDSYDDYYLQIACLYIVDMIKATEVKYTIFTNNYQALNILVREFKANDSIFFGENIDLLNDENKSNKNLKILISEKDIREINKSELSLMADFLNKDTYNTKLYFVAFITSLRNFRDTIINKYNKLLIRDIMETTIYNEYVSKLIEHLYMHYAEEVNFKLFNIEYTLKKEELKASYIRKLYELITNVSNSHILSLDDKSILDLRIEVLREEFDDKSNHKLLDYVYKKIVAISYYKYLIEEIMIKSLVSTNYDLLDINKIINTNSLGCKLDKFKKLISADSRFIDLKNQLNHIYNSFSYIINDYDHALNLMYPPYLTTSVRDIIKLKNDIIKLNNIKEELSINDKELVLA